MTERTNAVTMKSNPLTLTGNQLKLGDQMPDCCLVANDMSEKRLSDYKGNVVILLSVPSLDTSVCSMEARKFNEAVSKIDANVMTVTVSMDLPFAQQRWCAAQGFDQAVTLSDHKQACFGECFGVLIKELRLLARCVFVVDAEGVIRYIELVPEITDEPNYDAALNKAKELVK